MAVNLTEILKRVEAVVGQSVSVTEGDDDWNLRRSYLNRANLDWAETFDWPQLYAEVNSRTSLATSVVTIAMPADFRKLATHFKSLADNETKEYAQVDPQERGRFESTDQYAYVLGDPNGGYNLVINPALNASGASIFFGYYKTPASLVSGSDVSLCPNPNYLVQQTLYYYFLANEDARFQDARAEAEKILANMLEFESVKGKGYHNEVLNVDEVKHGFTWGKS